MIPAGEVSYFWEIRDVEKLAAPYDGGGILGMTGKMRFPKRESWGTKYPNEDLLACFIAAQEFSLGIS